MKLMSDPDLTQKVMSKLGQVPQSSQGPPAPPAESQEAPDINNLFDAARYAVSQQTTLDPVLQQLYICSGSLGCEQDLPASNPKPTAVCDSSVDTHKQGVRTYLIGHIM